MPRPDDELRTLRARAAAPAPPPADPAGPGGAQLFRVLAASKPTAVPRVYPCEPIAPTATYAVNAAASARALSSAAPVPVVVVGPRVPAAGDWLVARAIQGRWVAATPSRATTPTGTYGFRHRVGFCQAGAFDITPLPIAGCTVSLLNNATGAYEYSGFVTDSTGLTPTVCFGASTSYTLTVVEPSYAAGKVRIGPNGNSQSLTFTISTSGASACASPAVTNVPMVETRTTSGNPATQLYLECCYCPTPTPWDLSRQLLFTCGPLSCTLTWSYYTFNGGGGLWSATGTGTVSMTAMGAGTDTSLATRDVPVSVGYYCSGAANGVNVAIDFSVGAYVNPTETFSASCFPGSTTSAQGYPTLGANLIASASGVQNVYGNTAGTCPTTFGCADGGPPSVSGTMILKNLASQPWVRASATPWGVESPFALSQI